MKTQTGIPGVSSVEGRREMFHARLVTAGFCPGRAQVDHADAAIPADERRSGSKTKPG